MITYKTVEEIRESLEQILGNSYLRLLMDKIKPEYNPAELRPLRQVLEGGQSSLQEIEDKLRRNLLFVEGSTLHNIIEDIGACEPDELWRRMSGAMAEFDCAKLIHKHCGLVFRKIQGNDPFDLIGLVNSSEWKIEVRSKGAEEQQRNILKDVLLGCGYLQSNRKLLDYRIFWPDFANVIIRTKDAREIASFFRTKLVDFIKKILISNEFSESLELNEEISVVGYQDDSSQEESLILEFNVKPLHKSIPFHFHLDSVDWKYNDIAVDISNGEPELDLNAMKNWINQQIELKRNNFDDPNNKVLWIDWNMNNRFEHYLKTEKLSFIENLIQEQESLPLVFLLHYNFKFDSMVGDARLLLNSQAENIFWLINLRNRYHESQQHQLQ